MRSSRFLPLPLFPVLLAGLLTLTSGCNDGEATSSAPATPQQRSATRVEVLPLKRSTFVDQVELTGSVEAIHDATLSAQTSGTVTMILERGARVEEGEVVAQIDPEEEKAAVQQARAQYKLAQNRFKRQKPLYRDSIISALEFEQVRAERNQARASLKQAKVRLENTRVRAPFAGTVEKRFIEEGEQASPGVQVARVVNTRQVRVTAGVPERYANDIERGSPVRISFGRYQGSPRKATVSFVGSTIDPESRTFPIEVRLDNPERRLKPEMVAQLRVRRTRLEDVIAIPRAAIVRDETGTHAYVAVDADTATVARKQSITLGPQYAERAVVRAGLQAGDRLIVAGQNNVSPGAPLRIVETREQLPSPSDTTTGKPTLSRPSSAGTN